jgi:hypothetical protein
MFRSLIEKAKREWIVALGSVAVVLGGILDLLDALEAIDIQPLLPVEHAGSIMAGIGIAKIGLRFLYPFVLKWVAK